MEFKSLLNVCNLHAEHYTEEEILYEEGRRKILAHLGHRSFTKAFNLRCNGLKVGCKNYLSSLREKWEKLNFALLRLVAIFFPLNVGYKSGMLFS